MNNVESDQQIDKIIHLLSSNESQLVSSGFNLLLAATDSVWKSYLESNPECGHIIKCFSLGKQKLTTEILDKSWKTLTQVFIRGKYSIICPSLLQDIVGKYLKHIFHSLSRNTPESLTHSVLAFMSSAVLYDNHHANLIISHCNLPHNIYHYMYSHKSTVRPSIIKFVLSFFITDDFQLIRSILENKVVFSHIFRHIRFDPTDLSYFIMAVFAKKIFSVEISKKLKISVFSSSSMVQILYLLSNEDNVSLEDDPITFKLGAKGFTERVVPFCDYVEEFIKTLCSCERFGICYAPKLDSIQSYKYNNPAILHFLNAIPHQLRVGERVQRLIIELLHFCPDIVSTFLSDDWYSIAPRIKTEWVLCLEFLINFYHTQPLKTSIEKTGLKSALIRHNTTILSALVFSPQATKFHFNQGILHHNLLCKYLTSQLLTCMLTNFTQFDAKDNVDISPLIESIRFKLPDITIILSQLKNTAQMTEEQFTLDIDKFGDEIASKYSHLRDNVHEKILNTLLNLLLLYQQLFPLSILQANYDVSKLLTEYTTANSGIETMLIVLRIANEAPAGAIKWIESKSANTPLAILVNIYLLIDSQPIQSQIELCFNKFTREMSHLSVNPGLIILALSTARSMLSMTIFPEVRNHLLEIANLMVKVIENRKSEKPRNPDDEISFLIQILENNFDSALSDFDFLERFWKIITSEIYTEELLINLFYLFSKLIIKTGLIQQHVFKFFSQCFDLIFSERNRISNLPLPCQIIYFRLLDYFATWIETDTVPFEEMKMIERSIKEKSANIQTYKTLITAADINKLIEFGKGSSTEYVADVLKYVPYGFAQLVLAEVNTSGIAYLTEIAAKIDFHEWLLQSFSLSNVHPIDNYDFSTYYTNFLSHTEAIINVYFHSFGSELDHQSLLDYSAFIVKLLSLVNQLDQEEISLLTRLMEHCAKTLIRNSERFNRTQNDRIIKSSLKWLECLHSNKQIFTKSDAKRSKTEERLSIEIICSLLQMIAEINCNTLQCVLELIQQLDRDFEIDKFSFLDYPLINFDNKETDYIIAIANGIYRDILTSTNTQESVDIANKKIENSLLCNIRSQNNILQSFYEIENTKFTRSFVDNIQYVDISMAESLPLFKSYQGTLSINDQSALKLIRTLETRPGDSKLKPFVLGTCVGLSIEDELKVPTHLMQGHNPNDILANISPVLLIETISKFPVSKAFNEVFISKTDPMFKMYDPCFLLPLFSYILAPGVVVDCRKFAELGCLGFLFRCMSSLHYDIRASAAHCLERYTTHLTYNSFREKRQISLLLDITANTLTQELPRIPSIHTALLARTVNIMLHPYQDLFLLITKFLLSKPILNTEELPLFKTMIISSSPLQKREKLWMVGLLTEGILCEEDYSFYKRRHVFPLLFSMCDLIIADSQVCLSVVRFALRACSLPCALNDLNSFEGLLAWIIGLRTQLKLKSNAQEKTDIGKCLDEILLLSACEH